MVQIATKMTSHRNIVSCICRTSDTAQREMSMQRSQSKGQTKYSDFSDFNIIYPVWCLYLMACIWIIIRKLLTVEKRLNGFIKRKNCSNLSSVHTRTKEFKNGVFILKTHQMVSVNRRLKTQQSQVVLDLCLRKFRSGKS